MINVLLRGKRQGRAERVFGVADGHHVGQVAGDPDSSTTYVAPMSAVLAGHLAVDGAIPAPCSAPR